MTTPNPALGSDISPPGTAKLLLEAAPPKFTSVQLTDARGALVRGVREYLLGLVWEADGGRELRFKRVREGWAEPEQMAQFPAAAVYTVGSGTLEASGMTPKLDPLCRLPAPDGRYVVSPCSLVQDVSVEIWATDPQERMQLSALMEQALNPVLWRYGFALQLPFYFGLNATFEPKTVEYEDSEDQAVRRYRIARYVLSAAVPVARLVSVPTAKPRFDLRGIGTGTDVLVQFEVT